MTDIVQKSNEIAETVKACGGEVVIMYRIAGEIYVHVGTSPCLFSDVAKAFISAGEKFPKDEPK